MNTFKKTIQVKSKSGFTFPVDVVVNTHNYNCISRIFAGKATIELQEKNNAANAPALYISSFFHKEAKAYLQNYIPAIKGMKKGNIVIAIEPKEYSRIIKEIEGFTQPIFDKIAGEKARRKALEANQPKVYVKWDFLDWGDYSTNHERHIIECREPLPDETQTLKIIQRVAVLWNGRIGEHGDEWGKLNGPNREVSNYKNGLPVISKEEAEKWMQIAKEAEKEKEAEAEKEEKRKAKANAYADERAAKFKEAEQTGKPVMLHSYFLSGSDIPRKFQDDDSDMGHLVTYAMPDGSVKQAFSHSY